MRNDDADMVSPFDRDAFRRASVMLDNDDDDEFGTDAYRNAAAGYYTASSGPGGGDAAGNRSMHSPHMSEYSMQSLTGAGAGGVSRSNTMMMAGGAPAMHYAQQQQSAFDPSHVMAPPPPQAAYAVPGYAPHSGQLAPAIPAAVEGRGYHHDYHHDNSNTQHGAPAALGAYPNLNRGPSQVSSTRNRATMLSVGAADLSRRDSRASEYSQYSDSPVDLAIPPPAAMTDERGLPLVHEVEEPYTPPSATNKRFADFQRERQLEQQQRGHQAESVAAATHNGSEYNTHYRSGTPENANVQQTFFESSQSQYGGRDDEDAFHASSSLPAYLPDGQVGHIGRSWSAEGGHGGDEDGNGGDYATAAVANSGGHGHAHANQQHRRRLSVRNGGLDDFAEEEDDEAGYYPAR